MRSLVLSLPLVVSVLAACGPESSLPPLQETLEDPIAYFNLQIGRCWEYAIGDSKQNPPALGATLTEIDTAQFSIPTYRFVYRKGSSVVMSEWVAPVGNELKVFKRAYYGEGGSQFVYSPPLTLARWPMDEGVVTSAKADITSTAGVTLRDQPIELSAQVGKVSGLSLPIGASVSGFRMLYFQTPTRGTGSTSEARTLVPGAGDLRAIEGWAKLDLDLSPDGSGATESFLLQAIHNTGDEPLSSAKCGFNDPTP